MVYDVTSSFLWKQGKHQVLHRAGLDLTTAIAEAPHSEALLEKFPVLGVLRSASGQRITEEKTRANK
jgi:predicted heme/steroid binding protein